MNGNVGVMHMCTHSSGSDEITGREEVKAELWASGITLEPN